MIPGLSVRLERTEWGGDYQDGNEGLMVKSG